MAWYALYKWSRAWRVKSLYNWIRWYKAKLYHEWYDSLSEEDKLRWDKMVEEDKQRRKEEAQARWDNFMNLYSLLLEKTDSPYLKDYRLFNSIYK